MIAVAADRNEPEKVLRTKKIKHKENAGTKYEGTFNVDGHSEKPGSSVHGTKCKRYTNY